MLPGLSRGKIALGLLAVGLGVLAAQVSLVQGLALLAAFVIVPTVLAYPLLGLCLAITAIPLSSEWSVGVGGLNLTLMEPAVGLALVAWLLRGARERSLRLWPSALLVAQLLVLTIFLLSAISSEARVPSLKDTIKWVELVVVFVLAVDLARDAAAARWLALAIVGAAALEACFGMFQFGTGRGPFYFAIGPFMRAHGHFGQPNPFAGYLGTALPLALALAVLLPRDSLARWVRPAAALLVVGIVLSFSRGAWLGIACAIVVMLAVGSPRSRRWLVPIGAALLALGVLGTLGLLPAAVSERLGIIGEYFGPFDVRRVDVTPENWSVVERMAHWQAAWHMFLDHPWLGLGPGNYGTAYERYFLPGWLDPLGHAHNYYLNLAAEVGLVGLSA
jgi:O-antigen ligase